jgi:hypothetical protein
VGDDAERSVLLAELTEAWVEHAGLHVVIASRPAAKSPPTAGVMSIALIAAVGKVSTSRSVIVPSPQPISSIRRGCGTHAAMMHPNSSKSMNTCQYSSVSGLSNVAQGAPDQWALRMGSRCQMSRANLATES